MSNETNETIVPYFGQPMAVACDRKCSKAWGINNRPKVQLSDDPDDYAFLADDELGEAPVDPGTTEGGVGKPLTSDEFPTKWCVRECERCARSKPGEYLQPLTLPDFGVRYHNQPWEHSEPQP